MKKSLPLISICVMAAFVSAMPLHAQSGCVDSPENPTLILAGLGAAGFAMSSLKGRWKARRRR